MFPKRVKEDTAIMQSDILSGKVTPDELKQSQASLHAQKMSYLLKHQNTHYQLLLSRNSNMRMQ